MVTCDDIEKILLVLQARVYIGKGHAREGHDLKNLYKHSGCRDVLVTAPPEGQGCKADILM